MNCPQDSRHPYAATLRWLAIAGIGLTGCGAPSPASAEDPDPTELLSESTGTLYGVDSAALDLTATVRIARGGDVSETRGAYRFARRGDAKFLLEPVFEEGADTNDGVVARGDGALILTHILALGRYTLEESSAGFAAFVQSPLSQGVGSPLGGLGLSLLHPETTAEMVGRLTASEYVGEEPLGETTAHRCRYEVDDQVGFEVWFTTGDNPRAIRLRADLGDMMSSGNDDLEYLVTFDFQPASGEAPTDADFKLSEPIGAELVESFFNRSDAAPHRLLGKAAPEFELAGLDGEAVKLSDHLGKEVVVLDFWATWCPPCVAALPTLDSVTGSFADRGVVFYAVDQGESAETVSEFLEAKELSPPVLLDEEGEASALYDVEGLPTSVIIGRDGTVQVVHVGFSGSLETKLTEELEALVEGQDLAGEAVEAYEAEQAERRKRLERLRAKLAGPT